MDRLTPSSFREPAPERLPQKALPQPLTQTTLDVLVGATALPLLGGIVGARLLSQALTQLGQASEELFRGDRLPLLHDLQVDRPTSGKSESSS